MEVYIDNQKTNFGRRSNDLEKILKAISKKLEKNNQKHGKKLKNPPTFVRYIFLCNFACK